MIRIRIHEIGKAARVREYQGAAEAAKWLIEDSYFTSPDVRTVIWENIPDCEHRWTSFDTDQDFVHLMCDNGCGREISFEHSRVTRLARIVQR